jgi:class 3 adenylate cyclase/tetratricopeptide (TPR) repeat protein
LSSGDLALGDTWADNPCFEMTRAPTSLVCSTCGAKNPAESRFCRSCGSLLSAHAGGRAEVRKIVTVLFADLAGSTSLGDKLDPESLRQLMTRYFQEMGAVLRSYGGTVEKFIGDAIMAVFGVPRLHDDDALRAVRAAVAMRHALQDLNDEFERRWGVRIVIRTGVSTGEVIAGDSSHGESFVVGEAVNIAARLEQAAEPGTILIGETTQRLVRDAATTTPVEPLDVKGKPERVAAWNLIDVAPASLTARQLGSPLIGRDREFALLEEVFERTVEARSCELVTVMGPAGVGKSRLTREFVPRLGDRTTVVVGRCLPYGEGITFWPIIEVLRNVAGISDLDSPDEARRKIGELLEGPDAALVGERLAGLMGLADVTPGVQETFWAVRKLFDELAARRPLVVVFDDIHWAEPTFLDLLEYLVDSLRGVPVVFICLTRSELLEIRGDWMTAKANASLVALRPLSEAEMAGLIRNLLGGVELAAEARARIADAAEGNPLFVEETLRMLVDDGLLRAVNGTWTVNSDLSSLTIPPTINALLTARLDRLDVEERAVIERASVIGRVFWWGAVAEMSPEEQRASIGSQLQSLARKELIRPDHSDLREEDAFRFTHTLIVDAAYGGIPKAARAELHERFAAWIEGKRPDRAGEYEEIVGYHLEQAYRSLAELGPVNERVESLARRAATPLSSAGRRAFARGDMPAAVNVLSRAVSLGPREDPARIELLPELAIALLETGDLERTQDVIAETREAATTSADPRLQAHAAILELWVRLFIDPEGWADEAEREATRALSVFEDHDDEGGLARGWSLLGLLHLTKCDFGAAEEAWEKAVAHADAAGDHREKLESLSWVPLVVWGGRTPVEAGIRRCNEVLTRGGGDRKVMSAALFTAGNLEAMRGRFDEARVLFAQARSALEEVGLTVWIAGPLTEMRAWAELWAGDAAAAERELRWAVTTLQRMGELAWLPTIAGILGEALYAQGRDEEAGAFISLCEETAGSDDAYSQGLLRSVRAKILARAGRTEEAVRLGREAVAIAQPTDFSFLQAFVLEGLGAVLREGGFPEEADAALADATRAYAHKGFVVGIARAPSVTAGQLGSQ